MGILQGYTSSVLPAFLAALCLEVHPQASPAGCEEQVLVTEEPSLAAAAAAAGRLPLRTRFTHPELGQPLPNAHGLQIPSRGPHTSFMQHLA